METGGGEPPKRLAKMKKRCFLNHVVCIVCIVCIVYVVYIVGVPEFQNPEFQAATVESGVDKDGENRSFFKKERTFLVATAYNQLLP